jgi:hypothetical protein
MTELEICRLSAEALEKELDRPKWRASEDVVVLADGTIWTPSPTPNSDGSAWSGSCGKIAGSNLILMQAL